MPIPCPFAVNCPPVSHNAPVPLPLTSREDDTVVVPPAMVNVPCDRLPLRAMKTLPAVHVPFDTVICAAPFSPTTVVLVTFSCPPVSQTVPAAPVVFCAISRVDDSVFVPPAIVNVPED